MMARKKNIVPKIKMNRPNDVLQKTAVPMMHRLINIEKTFEKKMYSDISHFSLL